MSRRVKKKPLWQKKIALERIITLFELAKKELDIHPERSRRYVELLRKIGLRYNVRLPKDIKRSICKECNTILIPGKTAKVRLDSKKKTVIIKCLECGKIYRYPYSKEKE
ncbi:MAG: ribonuclease P [Candidatus Aenigmarchaeota archaeon]|nr:ribonuclease P [Candidatus Aenigmarchaeota archaeon]